MLSERERDFQPYVVSLEALVPEDNFYRQVEAKLDLTFVRDLVRHLYKPFGRPGIDPVVFSSSNSSCSLRAFALSTN